jgi:hypothetical protein
MVEKCTVFGLGNLKESNHLENTRTDRRTILNWIFNRMEVSELDPSGSKLGQEVGS